MDRTLLEIVNKNSNVTAAIVQKFRLKWIATVLTISQFTAGHLFLSKKCSKKFKKKNRSSANSTISKVERLNNEVHENSYEEIVFVKKCSIF